MIQSISEICKKEGCTRQELIRIAISKVLFEKCKSPPEANMTIPEEVHSNSQTSPESSNYDIPLDKIISVRYTLDDGKVIHIMRGKNNSKSLNK